MQDQTIVIYVTRTGNCRTIATKVSELTNGTLAEIGDLVNRSGKLAYLKAGASSFSGQTSPIQDPNVDLSLYTNIILVQPMWAFSICPPMRSWLEAHKQELQNKNIGMIVSYLGTNPQKIRTSFEKDYGPLTSFCALAEKTPEDRKHLELNRFVAEFFS
jgi:flavodoxin